MKKLLEIKKNKRWLNSQKNVKFQKKRKILSNSRIYWRKNSKR